MSVQHSPAKVKSFASLLKQESKSLLKSKLKHKAAKVQAENIKKGGAKVEADEQKPDELQEPPSFATVLSKVDQNSQGNKFTQDSQEPPSFVTVFSKGDLKQDVDGK
jgi:hypothetical protein